MLGLLVSSSRVPAGPPCKDTFLLKRRPTQLVLARVQAVCAPEQRLAGKQKSRIIALKTTSTVHVGIDMPISCSGTFTLS